tara:strand:+ start:16402 stop:17451 length:1050 start_codon:yes stop_codon:yes gene_type:complete
MKIISIVGARPQFIKLAPLSNLLKNMHNEVIIHTGQHYDKEMSNIFFNELEITKPHYNLDINQGNHGVQTGRMMIELESVIIKENPDLIIIFGDTNSTLAGAIVASKLHIPIIHIEAGLRSFNKKMPEEINRIATDHISDYLFAPTDTAMKNLNNENLSDKSYLTGDIMVESLKYVKQKISNNKIFEKYNLDSEDYYLLTLHRPYNVDNPLTLSKIFKEIKNLSKKIIFPIHPRSKYHIDNNNIPIPKNVIVTSPLGYIDFVHLQSHAAKIITDSGGIQKEAYMLKKPCITLRPETEWVETVESGWNTLFNLEVDENLAYTIEDFNPKSEYKNIFGKNILANMISIINK